MGASYVWLTHTALFRFNRRQEPLRFKHSFLTRHTHKTLKAKKHLRRDGKVAPWLKAFALLPEEPSSVPGIRSRRLWTTHTSSSVASNTCGLQGHTHTHPHKQTHTHLQIVKSSKSKYQEKAAQAGLALASKRMTCVRSLSHLAGRGTNSLKLCSDLHTHCGIYTAFQHTHRWTDK